MTDYEHTLTVAIKALSELIEDNRKLVAEIETLRESKPSTSSNQSSKHCYRINIDVLTEVLEACQGCSLTDKARFVSDCSSKFIITDGGDL